MAANKKAWFELQELNWRFAACAFWVAAFSFPVIGGFLLVWIFSPFHHVINICGYFSLLFAFRSWLLTIFISLINCITVKLHKSSYSVTSSMVWTRFAVLSKFLRLTVLLRSICYAFLFCIINVLIANFSTSQLAVFTDCHDSSGTFRCINESYFVYLLFGFILGFWHYMSCTFHQSYVLEFPLEQQGRFLSLKCNFTNKLVQSSRHSFMYLKYFLIFYYLFGFLPRYFASKVISYPFCDKNLVGFNNLAALISLAWTLWISGTLLLLLHDLSWHLFNVYTTQPFSFPVDSVFPEDNYRLLTENLSNMQSTLVQHLAFQYLSMISRYSLTKRQQLFAVKYEKGGNKSVKWDIVANECLTRVYELTNNLKRYQKDESKPSGLVSDHSVVAPKSSSSQDSDSRVPSASMLRRRPLSDVTNNSLSNISYFEVSPVGPTGESRLDASAYLNASTVAVPTPKLWTRQMVKNARSFSNEDQMADAKTEIEKLKPSDVGMSVTLYHKLLRNIRQLPVVSYFFSKIPSREAASLFINYNIYVWAIESVSFLVAASLTEDEYGFVQKRINEVVIALLELLSVLEKHCKLPIYSSSNAVSHLLRQQNRLKTCTKNAIYRITHVFARHIDLTRFKSEHGRKLKSFIEHKE